MEQIDRGRSFLSFLSFFLSFLVFPEFFGRFHIKNMSFGWKISVGTDFSHLYRPRTSYETNSSPSWVFWVFLSFSEFFPEFFGRFRIKTWVFGEKSVLEPIFLICIDTYPPGGITAQPNGDFWNFQIFLHSHSSFLASGDHQNVRYP